jgi:hypothetical protein
MGGSHGLNGVINGRGFLVYASNGGPERVQNRIERRENRANVLEIVLD